MNSQKIINLSNEYKLLPWWAFVRAYRLRKQIHLAWLEDQ